MNQYAPPSFGGQPSGQTYYYGGPGGFQPHFDPQEWKRREEQRQYAAGITRCANAIGGGLLLIQAIGTVLAFLTPALVDAFLPGASQSGSVFYDAIEYAVYSPVCILLSFFIAAKIAGRPVATLIPFEGHSPLLSAGCICFAFLGVAAGNYISGWVGTLFPQIEENLALSMGADPATPVELLVNILYVAAIPALVEEFAFRGVALGLLRPYGDGFAMVASSLCFALLHGNFIQIPFAFFMGLVLSYAVVRTGSIVPAMVIHFLNNAMSCLLTYFDGALSSLLGELYDLCVYGVWILLGLIGYLILRVGFSQKLTACYRPYAGCITTGRRTGAFYKGPALIVAFVIYLLTAVLMMLPLYS